MIDKLILAGLVFLVLVLVVTSGCVSAPILNGEQASLRTNHPIISLDGKTIDEQTDLRLQPGVHSLQAVYRTHLHDYICYFKWVVEANMHYEIVDHNNADPLTLYRWKRSNVLWAQRLEPLPPINCE
jgi:hypothetical protein